MIFFTYLHISIYTYAEGLLTYFIFIDLNDNIVSKK